MGAVLLLAWMGIADPAHGSLPDTPRFRSIRIEDGLPSSQVNQMEQTRNGFIWFGTKDGLARFDGGEFKVFQHEPGNAGSLPGSAISALHVDARDRVWAAISGHGVVRMDPETGAFVRFPAGQRDGPTQDTFAIASTGDGATWFGTFSEGLFRLAPDGTWHHFGSGESGPDRIPSDEVLALAVDPDGVLWAGTGDGLLRWSGHGFLRPRSGDPGHGRIVMLEADVQGLWLGTAEGLRVRTPAGEVMTPPWQSSLSHPVFATMLDRSGTRWLATSAGLRREQDGKLLSSQIGAPLGFAFGNTLLEDAEGGIWAAQRGFGVMHSPAGWRRFSTFGPHSGASGTHVAWIKVFAESGTGGVWLAGVGGLDRFDRATGSITPVLTSKQVSGCHAVSASEVSDGSVWLGCLDGLVRFDPTSRTLQRWSEASAAGALPHGAVTSIVEDRNGVVWLQVGDDIQGRDRQGRVVRNTVSARVAAGSSTAPLTLGPDGDIWFGTTAGLLRIRVDTRRVEPVEGLAGEGMGKFAFGQPGYLWIQRGRGLDGYRWNGQQMVLDRSLRNLPEELALPGALFVDSLDRIWATSVRGLLRVDPSDASVRSFDTEDGLPSRDFQALPPLVTKDGLVFASTSADFVVFDPASFRASRIAPRVKLDSISLRHEDEIVQVPTVATRLVLGANDRDLRITARIASLAGHHARRFGFFLHGYDRDWVEDKEGERVFTRLEHGTYRMEVRAASADGVWSESRSLDIEVLPHWWQTTSARLAFAALCLGLLLAARAAHRARLRGIHERQSLEERRALAEQASQAKSRFLADLGHEIRTPMTGVLGMAELMHADAPDERQRARIEAIQSAGRHLLVLLNDALDLARIEAGRLDLQDVAYDLPALLADACALLRPQAEAKRLAFELQLPPDLPRGVRGDPVRLRQILLNLGHNAIKFTASGGIRVEAVVEPGRLRIDVVDTGPGMDAARVARLFGRFEQADGARTWAHFGGSGLGLSICRELAQAMRGDIEVDSAPGRGTCFRVLLPLVPEALPAPPPLASLRVREPLAAVRVLVVEDDALVGEVVCALLEHLGHDAQRAAHGLEVLAAVAAGSFDLVLMDLDLPGMDGFALARLLRAQGFDAPIVALTARVDADAEARARAAGMVDFARKPVTGEVLAGIVARRARRGAGMPA